MPPYIIYQILNMKFFFTRLRFMPYNLRIELESWIRTPDEQYVLTVWRRAGADGTICSDTVLAYCVNQGSLLVPVIW